MPFRFKAKTAFLTYAQVAERFSHQELFDHIKQLRDIDPLCLRVGKESHEDGGIHYHVYAKWGTAIDTINEKFFDFNGVHPNIQAARNEGHVYAYCGKDGETIDFGIPPKHKRTYGEIIKESTTEAEFFEKCAEAFPRDYVINHERLEYFAKKKFKQVQPEYKDPYDGIFNIPPVLEDWIANNITSVNAGNFYILDFFSVCACYAPSATPLRRGRAGSAALASSTRKLKEFSQTSVTYSRGTFKKRKNLLGTITRYSHVLERNVQPRYVESRSQIRSIRRLGRLDKIL